MQKPSKPTQFNYTWDIAGSDLTAGATVAAFAVPQAIAYSAIAQVDPRYGLYSAIVVTIVAAILGSSSHLINGPTNAISLVVLSGLASFALHPQDAYQAMLLLGIIAGTIQIAIAVFRLGDLTRYVSESVILGFMAGAGLLIGIGQLGDFFGAAKKGTAEETAVFRAWETLSPGVYNGRALALGVGTIIVVIVLRQIINRYKLPRVDMLGGLIIASAVAAYFGWSIPQAGKTTIAVVDTVPGALPAFHLPDIQIDWVERVLTSSLAVALLGLLEALAVAKSIATYTRQPLDYNKQCFAEGTGNLVGGFFQCMPGSGSLSRSAINYQSGAITRLSGVYSGIIVAIVVYFLGPYSRFIPKAALAGLLLITAARLIDWRRLFYAVRASWFDAALVLVTAFVAVFISVEKSILCGVALSIILFVPRASKLSIRELIVTSERVIRERQAGEAREKSVLIYDLEGELFFGAAPELHRHLEHIQEEAILADSKCVVLRLRRTRNPDMVAIEHLEHFLHEADKLGIVVLLAGIRPDFLRVLDNLRFKDWLPSDRIFPEEQQVFSATLRAVRHAYTLISAEAEKKNAADEKNPVYYLV